MLSVIGGLAVMLGSSPLAAQTPASAERSFDPATVAPGGSVTVMITAADYGSAGGVTETLSAGFAYVSTSLDDSQVLVTGQVVRFTLQGDASFTYVVTASSTEGSYSFSGMLRDDDRVDSVVGGPTEVTVAAGTETPDPTPEATVLLPIPNLDNLTADQTIFTVPAGAGNNLVYTPKDGATDAKVAVRVSPGTEAIANIDLNMTDPDTGQKVNFSLTDGENLEFQIKKTDFGTAEIVVKEGGNLSAGQYPFQLVVNEFEKAPANSFAVDFEVIVVVDNEAPEWESTPESEWLMSARWAKRSRFSARAT